MKNIVCVTGCRSEYDIIYPVMKALSKDRGFDVSVIVTGAHLSRKFGYTVRDIVKDGFRISGKVRNLIDTDKFVGKARGAGLLISGLSAHFDRLKPDFVIVAGDREEAIASAVASTYLCIPLIHLCGGDSTKPKAGDFDEAIRHATSKMASIHFTMTEAHRNRLIRMGEEPSRVFNVGDPALDRFAEIERFDRKRLLRYFGLGADGIDKPLILMIQHVISGEAADAVRQIRSTLEAITALDANCVINYPNTDPGSRAIIEEVNKYAGRTNVRLTRNIPRREFVNLLRQIDLLVGNSSMALLEGSFLKIPAINVGNRNKDRLNGGNVLFVKADKYDIRRAAEKILYDNNIRARLKACRPIYGDGKAASRIVRILKKLIRSRAELAVKSITY